MRILYSQKNMINCFEGCAIGNFYNKKKGLILYNKNLIKFYSFDENGNLDFLYDKLVLENVIQLETYNISSKEDGLLILFESTKISSVHFVDEFPVINSLKCFERDQYDIKLNDIKFLRMGTDIVIVKLSKRFFGVFSLHKNQFPAKVFAFTEIDEKIKNVTDLVFLSNYIVPTFCIIYNSTPRTYIKSSEQQAIICSFDYKLNTFYVIDEFNVPVYTKKVLFDKDMLLVISENEIICKTSDSCYNYPINKRSVYFKNEPVKNFIIRNALFYFKDRHLLIFNGDGLVYSIYIKCDSGRIVDLIFNEIEYLNIPKFIYSYKEYLFIGSNEESILFKIDCTVTNSLNEQIEHSKKTKLNVTELELIINEEYERIYGSTAFSVEKNNLFLETLYQFPSIGYINDLCVKNDKEFVCCSEGLTNYIVEFTNYLNFGMTKIFDCINYEKIVFYKNNIFVKRQKELISVYENFDFDIPDEFKLSLCNFEHASNDYIITDNQILVYKDSKIVSVEKLKDEVKSTKCHNINCNLFYGILYNSYTFEIRNDKNLTIARFEMVNAFCFYENFCILNIKNDLIFYDLVALENRFIISDFTNLNLFYNMENVDDTSKRDVYFKLIEMEIIKIREVVLLFIINERGNFAIYRKKDKSLIKMFIEEPILFVKQKSNRYFIQIGDFIYLNSKTPRFLYLNDRNEIFCYRTKFNIRDILKVNGKIFFLIHDKLVHVDLPEIKTNSLIKKSNMFRNKLIFNDEIYDRFIFKKKLVDKTPKNIEISGKYILLVSSTRVKYQEEEDSLDVYTQKYVIDLYTNYYKLISTFELENDEYVFDIKELFLNDVIGENGKSNFIVVCVTKIEGEDKHSRGRLIVLEIIDIVVDETNKHKNKKLKLIASENIKGCIIKCDVIEGNVIVALGIKTMIYKIDRSEGLIPIGIHDLSTLTTSLITIKNYVVFSDIYRGLSFFYFQKKPVRLNLLCISEPINYATHVDFLVRGSSLGIVCTDINGNMTVYTYSPLNILSCDGTKFVKRCETDFNLGRLVMKRSLSKFTNPIYISDSNILIQLSSISEENYQSFLKVQNYYLSCFNDTFGLNSMNFNNLNFHLKPPSVKKPVFVEIILRFLHLPIDKRKECDIEEVKIFDNLQ